MVCNLHVATNLMVISAHLCP